MSAPRLQSAIDLGSDEAKARAAHNRALAEKLCADVAEAAKGGPEKHRERHVGRGKLLPRDRVERLLDPASPFLEIGQLAAFDLYEGEVPGAGLLAAQVDIRLQPRCTHGATPSGSGRARKAPCALSLGP